MQERARLAAVLQHAPSVRKAAWALRLTNTQLRERCRPDRELWLLFGSASRRGRGRARFGKMALELQGVRR